MPAATAVFLLSSTALLTVPIVANLVGADPNALKDVTEPIARQAAKAAIGLLEDERMRYWCVIGAFCGAWMSVLAFRPTSWHEAVAKWLVSFMSSIIFIPFAIDALGMSQNTSAVLAISGLAALLGWTLVQKSTPLLEAFAQTGLIKWARGVLGMPVDYSKNPPKRRK